MDVAGADGAAGAAAVELEDELSEELDDDELSVVVDVDAVDDFDALLDEELRASFL